MDVFEETTIELPAGSLLFFYTDGLVERRGTPLLDSLEHLRKVVAEGPASRRRSASTSSRKLASPSRVTVCSG